MTRRGRGREPTPEDLEIWATVSKSVRPLGRRPKPVAPPEPAPKPARPTAAPAKRKAERPAPPPVRPPTPEPPRLIVLDRRTRSKVARGTVAIDTRIDLHGLTQAAAHQRLRRFLDEAQAEGARLALVITGKGEGSGGATGDGERGVLRRMVPIWLGSAELRPYVIGYEPAGRRHGREGALYVRIRSRKAGR